MKKKCHACGKIIDLEVDKHVLLGTYNGTGKAKKNEDFFHFECWVDHFNQKIIDRISKGQDQAMKMLAGSLKRIKISGV